MHKNNLSKKLYILISIFLITILAVIMLFNKMNINTNRKNEEGAIYAIIHMNAIATWGLKADDLYKESLPIPLKFSLLEKNKDIEQWDIEVLSNNEFLSAKQDLNIYIKNKRNFYKKINYIFGNQYLGHREHENKNGKYPESERYSVVKIPFVENKSKNYLEICYDDVEFIYGLNTKENCREFIKQKL